MKKLLMVLVILTITCQVFADETSYEVKDLPLLTLGIASSNYSPLTSEPTSGYINVIKKQDDSTWGIFVSTLSADGRWYVSGGIAVVVDLEKNLFLKISGGPGYNINDNRFGLTNGLSLIKQLETKKYWLIDCKLSSDFKNLYYEFRAHWQFFPIFGCGVRAQASGLVGPYIHIGHDAWGQMWFGAGLAENNLQTFCVSTGIQMIF